MTDKFVLRNVGKTNVDFTIYTPLPEGAEWMAKHKIRKLKNANNIFVRLKPNTSVDLLDVTRVGGFPMTVKQLMDNVEVRELVNIKTDRIFAEIEGDGIQLKEEITEAPEEEPEKKPEVVEEPPKEEPPKEEPKEPPKKAKKKSKDKEPPIPMPPPVEPPAPTLDPKGTK